MLREQNRLIRNLQFSIGKWIGASSLFIAAGVLVFTTLFVSRAFSEDITPPHEIQDNKYHLSPGDVLEIDVFEVEELTRTLRVRSDGYITLPLLGAVKAQGLTERELEKRLEGFLEEKYLHNPQVSVFVKESGYFYVLGRVENKEGMFQYRPGITLQQAIAMAGAFPGDEEGFKEVRITRNIEGEEKRTFTLDYAQIAEGSLGGIPIMRDDVVFVKGLGKFYVTGYVRRPGAFDMRSKMTVQQAIAYAGGVSDIAKASRVQIKRVEEDGGVKTIDVNFNKIMAGEAADLEIKEDDIIHVPKSYLLRLVRAIFFSIGVGDRHSVGVSPTTFVGR